MQERNKNTADAESQNIKPHDKNCLQQHLNTNGSLANNSQHSTDSFFNSFKSKI